jgi:Kef-type K+ transport system membrane component KefB
MIHVGYEFEIEKSRPKQYAWDYLVAGTAAAFPWIFCAAYFVWVLGADSWKDALLLARFSSPTSAGVLFSMLAAAGLAATWVFMKARVLAIFDDLDTILLMIPLKMLMVGMKWQLAVIVLVIAVQLWLAWRYLHVVRLPVSWPWVMLYAGIITGVCEAAYLSSLLVDDTVPVHIEVLLPAFVLGCMLARPEHHAEHKESPASPREGVNWGAVAGHVLLITVLSNVGKMFPTLCYRQEASFRERLALSIGMFPRGEVGAGVLVVSLSYGLAGTALTVAVLSLALNLLLTGVFIAAVKRLIAK